jgi:UDP-N-acetylglucosamine 1-carboxyvinyltransferase
LECLLVKGKQVINGSIKVNGAKNAAVAILPAALLTEGIIKVENLPRITDIDRLVEILQALGARVAVNGNSCMRIDLAGVKSFAPPASLVNKLRASYYFMGALLGRFREVAIPMPGGCNLGPRPIDQHIKGFTALGASVELEHGIIKIKAKKLIGAHIYLDVVSVGATVNIMWLPLVLKEKQLLRTLRKNQKL